MGQTVRHLARAAKAMAKFGTAAVVVAVVSAAPANAAGDLLTAVPSLWNDMRWPMAIVMIISGAVAGAMKLMHGFASAAGKVIGGIALAALVLGAIGLAASFKMTADRHTGGVTVGQYGQ
jgi:uncharacterized membrane protein